MRISQIQSLFKEVSLIMKNKIQSLIDLIIGVLFLAVGAVLLFMESGMKLVIGLAAADLLFGAALLISGIIGMTKRGNDEIEEPEEAEEKPEYDWNAPVEEKAEIPAPAAPVVIEQPEEPVRQENSVEALTAREAELRKLVKQRRADARQAAEDADRAAAAAAAAERALVDAENAMKNVSDNEKRAYLAQIDRLADEAMDKSQQAAFAARKAKVTERAMQEAVAEHRKAMDAAAEAMMAAEEAEWNSR